MNMKRLKVNGKEIAEKSALHRLVASQLGFPDWYGNNLDALYDCLTDISEPTEITVLNKDALISSLGGYATAFFNVLRESAAENEDILLNME